MDLKNGLLGLRVFEERERLQREEIWLWILTYLGIWEGKGEIFGVEMKWMGRESVMELKGAMER